MPYLTEKIKLNPTWEKRYKLLRVFVFFIFLAGMIWLCYLIIFPSQYFSFSCLHPNSSRNNIINFHKIENELIFNTVGIGNFSKAKVTFLLEKNSVPLENTKVSIRKSYQAFFYPTGENISSSVDYSINSLVSSGKSVLIVGHGRIFPIDNPLTFELAGFKWNNVETANGKDLSLYEKQSLFNIYDAHPSGTVFLAKDTRNYFYIQNEKKYELKNKALINPDLKKKAITVEEKGLTMKKECLFKNSFFSTNNYSCIIPIDELNSLIGKDYRFETDIDSGVKVKKINVVLYKTTNWENLIRSLSEIKNKILLRYGLQQEDI